MLKNLRSIKGIAFALTVLMVFSDVALRSGRAASEPPEQGNAVSATASNPGRTATFHSFDIEEVFSNVDGSVQFIELLETEGADGNSFFAGNLLRTDASFFNYPVDLPGTRTANRFVLIATAGFAALPGAVTPDYIIPQRFIETTGDTISIFDTATSALVDSFTFGASLILPTDGILSLNRDGTTGVNSPTNFAGETGSVSAAAPIPASSFLSLAVMASLFVIAAVATTRTRRRRLVQRG